MISTILRDLRHELEAACAERDRLWAQYGEGIQQYNAASKREIEARAALHAAIMAAAGMEV